MSIRSASKSRSLVYPQTSLENAAGSTTLRAVVFVDADGEPGDFEDIEVAFLDEAGDVVSEEEYPEESDIPSECRSAYLAALQRAMLQAPRKAYV